MLSRSCGTLTVADTYSVGVGDQLVDECDKTSLHDTANYCNVTPFTDKNGNAVGDTIFVLVNCSTGEPLDMSKQEPAYSYPGVSTGLPNS